MIGDSRNAVWGVMDVYPRTNFPDVRKKTISTYLCFRYEFV